MNFFQKNIVGIDFHDYYAEVVELSRKGKVVALESYNRITLPSEVIVNGEIKKENELKSALINFFKNANPKPILAKNTAIILPSSKILTHIFTFPVNLSESEIKTALPYQAETQIPFSINDVYFDFTVIERENPAEKHASQYVFFACIIKETADKYSEVLESIGLVPFLVGINSESLKYSIAKQILEKETLLIIDAGTLSVNYLLIKNGITKYFYSTNEAGAKLIGSLSTALEISKDAIIQEKNKNNLADIQKPELIAQFIESNFKRAVNIMNEQESTAGKVTKVFLTGEFLNLPGFENQAKTYFLNQKPEIIDPKCNLQIIPENFSPYNKSGSAPYSIYFTNSIGIALKGLQGHTANGINLLPDRLKENLLRKRNAFLIAISSIAMAAISLFIATFSFFKFYDLNFERKTLEIEKSSVEKMIYGTRYQEIRDEIISFNTEVDILSSIDQSISPFSFTLNHIYSLIPEDAAITSITFNNEDLTMELSGIAKTRENLLNTQKSLENDEFISEVVAPISNYDEKSQISFQFKIKLDINKIKNYVKGASNQPN